MKSSKHYFAIGLFTILGFILLAAGCVLFGGADLFANKAHFETYFDSSVQGLDVGSPVKFRGVRLGAVESIAFAGNTYAIPKDADARPLTYIRVVCAIDLDSHPQLAGDAIPRLIARGVRANLALQGITGQLFVNLDFPRNGSLAASKNDLAFPWRPVHPAIPSTPTTLQNFLNIAQDIAANLGAIDFSQVTDSLKTLTDNINAIALKADIPTLTTTFTALGKSLTAQSERLGRLLDRLDTAQLGHNLATISDNLAQTSTDLRAALPTLSAELTQTLRQLDQTLAQASQTLDRLGTDIDTHAIGRDVAETLDALARTAAATEALVQELRQKPSRLIFDAPLED